MHIHEDNGGINWERQCRISSRLLILIFICGFYQSSELEQLACCSEGDEVATMRMAGFNKVEEKYIRNHIWYREDSGAKKYISNHIWCEA